MKRTKKLLSFFLAIMMVITTIPAFTLTANAATINETAYNNAINAYVSKMNDSYVYYNMEAAYNAYIALKQSYDVCKYGGGSTTVTADTVNSNITTLNTAVSNMTPWSQYNPSFVPTAKEQMFAGDSASGIVGTKYKDYYVNLLYASGPQDDITSQSESSMRVYWNMPYAVALYTGSEIRIPVMCGLQNTSGDARYLFTSWLGDTTGGIDYGSNWMYRDTATTKHFSWIVDSPSQTPGVSKQQSNANNYKITVPGKSTRFVANYFSIKQTGFTDNYKAFTSLNLQARGSGDAGHSNNPTYGAGLRNTGASVGFYIIDYRPVTNNVTTAKTKIRDNGIANFDADNIDMSSYMEAMDKLTNINNTIKNTFPSNASNVSKADCQTKADSVAKAITSSLSSYTSINGNTTADSARTTAYNNLRSAMDNAMANYQKGEAELKKTYTANSVNAFITAYNNAKSIMSQVERENYGHNASDTNTKANALKNASLVEKADFSQLESNYNSAQSKIADASSYTKTSLEALKTVVNNTVYAKYSDDTKANTAKTTNTQNSIDSESTAIANAIAALVQRASFEYYDSCVSQAADVLRVITAKDGQYIRVYRLLQPYESITLYADNDRENTPITSQADINNVGSAIASANTNLDNSSVLGTDYVDQTALKSFIVQNFDLDVVNNDNIKAQKKSAEGLYETVPFNGTNYYSLNVTSQSDLDAKVRGYINSINSTIGKYDIKVPAGVKVAVANNTQTPTSTVDGICTYRLTYGVPITFTSTNKDTAWYMSYVSNVAQRGMQYQCSGLTYATKVMGNMTVTPKSSSNSKTPNKVTVIRQYSNGGNTAMLIDYVGNSFKLPAVQTYPNYTFRGYELAAGAGSNTKIENGKVTGINGDTVIYAKYDALGNDCAITITKTDGTTTTANYKYNSAVSLNDPNAYAWIEKPNGSDWRPSYIGTGCSYKVTEPMELKAVTKAEFDTIFSAEAYAPNLRYNGPLVANGMGVVFHGQFINYVPAGAQIVEYGVAVNVNNANSFDLINTNGKVIRCKSTNPMKSNQFSVGARYNGTTFTNSTTISYRSYMIYQITVNGQLETKYVYSDVRHFPENA